MTWRLWWEHTSMLVEEARASCAYDLTTVPAWLGEDTSRQ
jgi:hypothetical protein